MPKTLYERLGGATGISKIVDDLVDAHLKNPRIQARFLPYLDRPDVVAEVKRHTRDFLGAASGGPEQYKGRTMTDAHCGMNISDAEFAAAIDDIVATLEKNGVDGNSREEILGMVTSLKSEIIDI
jgi:hemoglobin